jgi:hypothetical protein
MYDYYSLEDPNQSKPRASCSSEINLIDLHSLRSYSKYLTIYRNYMCPVLKSVLSVWVWLLNEYWLTIWLSDSKYVLLPTKVALFRYNSELELSAWRSQNCVVCLLCLSLAAERWILPHTLITLFSDHCFRGIVACQSLVVSDLRFFRVFSRTFFLLLVLV